jgi:hypothetical protein
MSDWIHLDLQMARWAGRLRDDVLVSSSDCAALASAMAAELTASTDPMIRRLADRSPVPLRSRLDELVAFQSFADLARDIPSPPLVRAQVIAQCYVCFVYLKDNWFDSLTETFADSASVSRVARYLTTGRVRSFRHAFAHGNWKYTEDFSGLQYWDRGFMKPDIVSQKDLDFWQSLSRCAAYVTIHIAEARAT